MPPGLVKLLIRICYLNSWLMAATALPHTFNQYNQISSSSSYNNPLRVVFPDFITPKNRTVYIEEDKESGSFLASVSVLDNPESLWNLTVSNDKFQLLHSHQRTWSLYTGCVLDRENQTFHQLTISARPFSGSKYAEDEVFSHDIFIEVVDINDNIPQFNSNVSYIIAMAVGSLTKKTEITRIQANDVDLNENGRVEYSLDNYNDLFEIGSVDGRLLSKTYLRSGAARYDIIIRATDGGIPPLSNSIVLTLHLVEDRWSLYRLYRYHIAIGRRLFRQWALQNQLKFSFVPFTSEFSSTEESCVTSFYNNRSQSPVKSPECFYNSTFPMLPCIHVDKTYDRAEMARIIAKTGCKLKCKKCEVNCGKYTVRCFDRNPLPIICDRPSTAAVNRSHSDDGCYCSSDISSENSDRRRARECLIVTSVDDPPLQADCNVNSIEHNVKFLKPPIIDKVHSASFV
ncbi:hypothetical protein GJ496_002603 [Pomphorhynchus laevis]|nr:hypothetical protein GJ496_002603 [Pomphorhynchus laevis]